MTSKNFFRCPDCGYKGTDRAEAEQHAIGLNHMVLAYHEDAAKKFDEANEKYHEEWSQ